MLTAKYDQSIELRTDMLTEVFNLYSGLCEGEISFTEDSGGITAALGNEREYARYVEDSSDKTAKLALYKLLRKITGVSYEWGDMTGVKPLKKYLQLKSEGMSDSELARFFAECFEVSEQKISLMAEIAAVQQPYLNGDIKNVSFYAHIPLCPSKCRYCSFPSKVTAEGSGECEAYLNALLSEAERTKSFLQAHKLTIDSAYFGGGTPSVLSIPQLEKMFDKLSDYLRSARELTFEAGRSDTLSEAKLRLLRDWGVNRISVNAQTTNDASLTRIGRKITNGEFLTAFKMAERVGFENINCDLILGLEGEAEADFTESIKEILKLSPSNITLHTLCAKRTAALTREELQSQTNIALYQNIAREMLGEKGYRPYYVYKQKNALNGGENVGYAKMGSECVYNIRMMGEGAHIISLGAGATSKLSRAGGFGYRDVIMPKDYTYYIENVAELTAKKLSRMEAALTAMEKEYKKAQ